MLDQDEYRSSGGKVPLRWTAPEALFFKKFSSASDAWSFACILHEIFNNGEVPYKNLPNNEVLDFVDEGRRLPPGPDCPAVVYQLMIKLWHPSASERPTMTLVVQQLDHWRNLVPSDLPLCDCKTTALQNSYCQLSNTDEPDAVYGRLTDAAPQPSTSDMDAYCWSFGECFIPNSVLVNGDWLFGNLDRVQAELILEKQSNPQSSGNIFLVRSKEAHGTYVLSIKSGRKFVHHILKQNASLLWSLNEKAIPVRGTIEVVLKWLRVPHEEFGWTAKLGNPASCKLAEQSAGLSTQPTGLNSDI